MTHTISIIVNTLSDGSDVFAVRIMNVIGKVQIDAITEDDARNMAECFQKAIEAYGSDNAKIEFSDRREARE